MSDDKRLRGKERKKSPEYAAWSKIKGRCYNINDKKYPDYGGRGIRVCDRWLESFENFLEDMGKRPENKNSINRIDNNGDYCPENCEWADDKTQSRNKRNNIFITYRDRSQILRDWTNELGLSHAAIRDRLVNGWSVEKAFETPSLKSKISHEYNGKTMRLNEWSKELNIPYRYFNYRVNSRKETLEQAVELWRKNHG